MRRSGKQTQRGSALVEFAIGWWTLWLLFSGVYEFGYAFYVYNSLKTAVANAAQLGSKLDYDISNGGSAFTQSLENMVVYGDETAGTKSILPGLTTGNVSVNVTVDAANIPRYVTVSIANYQLDSIFKTWTWSGKPRATTVYYGKVVCPGC